MSLRIRNLRLVTPANRTRPGLDLIDGVALGGIDPTSYHLDGEPRRGNQAFRTEWGGGTWWFQTDERRERFDADPARWAPQFGGHCAVGRATGVWVDADPRHWHLDDGRLYLNKNALAHHAHRALRPRIQELATELAAAAGDTR